MNILVPVDGSDHSIKALHYAISMAKAYGDNLIILNIQPSF